MTEKTSTNYLKILENLVAERRAEKEKANAEYQQLAETFSSIDSRLDVANAEYEPFEITLEPLQQQRDELNQRIRVNKNRKTKLEKELEDLDKNIQLFENEVKPLRDEIGLLMRQSKSLRDKRDGLWAMYFQVKRKYDEAEKRVNETQRDFSEANYQYWLALQWEKRKPLIVVTALVFLFLVILVAFVWAATQLPLVGFIPVVIITFIVFFIIVITLLRQDEKLREESFMQLARDILQYLKLIRK